jgi:hypothetical protein
MEINNSFEVPLPPAEAWAVLMDIERIAPCMPGAELTGVVDKDTYNGKVSVRLGPVALAFAGQVKFTTRDDAAHTARVVAQGKDSKGRGGANANVDFRLEPSASGSLVQVKTDLTLSGAVAQYGRASGLIQDVAQQLIGQFATHLKARLDAERPAPGPVLGPVSVPAAETALAPRAAVAPAAKPISGVSLIFAALWNTVRRAFGGS